MTRFHDYPSRVQEHLAQASAADANSETTNYRPGLEGVARLRMHALALAFPLAGKVQCQLSRSKQSREIVATAETQNGFPRGEPDGHVHGQLLFAYPFVGRLREGCLSVL